MFALRFGGSAAIAIAPYLGYGCVPDISLENISLKFNQSARLERSAIHEPFGSRLDGDPGRLLRLLRDRLSQQAAPVVDAIHDWSGFSRLGTWGLIVSAWTEQFTEIGAHTTDPRNILPMLDVFLGGNDVVARMRPTFHPVSHLGVTHLCQRRASCCRYYLLPQKNLCASCPLVPPEQRMARNRQRIERFLERERDKRPAHHGHAS